MAFLNIIYLSKSGLVFEHIEMIYFQGPLTSRKGPQSKSKLHLFCSLFLLFIAAWSKIQASLRQTWTLHPYLYAGLIVNNSPNVPYQRPCSPCHPDIKHTKRRRYNGSWFQRSLRRNGRKTFFMCLSLPIWQKVSGIVRHLKGKKYIFLQKRPYHWMFLFICKIMFQ